MNAFTLNLKDFFSLDTDQDPTLSCYILDPNNETDPNRKHPSILVIPGGGYHFTSEREAEPIALNYLSMGYNAFVLNYSVAPARYPEALLEASACVALMRKNSDKWFVDVNKIAVIGFSAGGHLAGSLSLLCDEKIVLDTLKIQKGQNKPNAAILAYPVVTSDKKHAHMGSFENLLGENLNDKTLYEMSLENRVTPNAPPMFIWHTASDTCVPVMNSLILAEALSKNNVPFELHIFPEGNHGLANCNITTAGSPQNDWQIVPHCERWVELSRKWLLEVMKF